MITYISIKGFKRFENADFELRPLTVLAGLNGTGKSSLIHALLLVTQASKRHSGETVPLNNLFGADLAPASDVLNWRSQHIEISVGSSDRSVNPDGAHWRFKIPHDDALYLQIDERPRALPFGFSDEPGAFTYLSAERFGPRSVLQNSPIAERELGVGVKGEYTAQVLARGGNFPIGDSRRRHPTKASDTQFLKYEVENWLSEIVRPLEVDVVEFPAAAFTALRFRSPGGEWVRAPNMGFGVSYALPIIVSGLQVLGNGILVVENPEAHLHPAGQSRIGIFLAWLAGCGVQVVLETHSDHVLNGIRRAIAEHKYLEPSSALVHFFEDQNDSPHVHHLGFTQTGGMENWPQGFFDQYQIDVSALGRIRRRE